jgi:DNA-binding NtrC family response regulator
MRQRRAILFDDDPAVLGLLTLWFGERGYEVMSFDEPVQCPVYAGRGGCDRRQPCGDIMITDLQMPAMSGLELLELQACRGCGLDVRNKAVLSGSLDAAALEAVRRLGCAAFAKPFRLARLEEWVRGCESRMDLSLPLGIRRRERREECRAEAVVAVGPEGHESVAELLNRSDSGLCIRLDRPLAVEQVLHLRTPLPAPAARLTVRWTRPDAAGRFLAGTSSR